ncbi:MAG: haloacid dehalogenase-like hydrolase [Butyrivibrio sp.]|nr:haloacid dehalogenase-like hydrolase [Butyrivibrio sp.]
MNVYDFDGTICYPNSTVGFAFWCMNRHPSMWVTFFPKIAISAIMCEMGLMSKHRMIRRFFSFLGEIDDFDEQIEKYWDAHETDISAWYLRQSRPDDLIISASPTCVIAPIAKRLGVKFVATEYDRETGVFVDNLMYAKGKSRYIFDNDFPLIENFYSDSLSDTPLALCAEKAYLVTDRAKKVVEWPHLDENTLKKVHRKIDTGWTVHL